MPDKAATLLTPIELPDRSQIRTLKDMAMVLLQDEEVIRAKNADLDTLAIILGTQPQGRE